MNRSIFLTFCLIQLLIASCTRSRHEWSSGIETTRAPSIEWEIRTIFGGLDTAIPDSRLAIVGPVSVSPSGDIWVGDRGSLKLKILGPNGQHEATIGGRGDGPGRFWDIAGIVSPDSSSAYVIDYSTGRVTRISKTGQILDVREFDNRQMGYPLSVFVHPMDRSIVVFSLPFSSPEAASPEDLLLFSEWDLSFSRKTSSFGSLSIATRNLGDFLGNAVKAFPGSTCMTRSGRIVFAPVAYRGVLSVFEKQGRDWTEVDQLLGKAIESEPVQPADVVAALWRSLSVGVFEAENGEIVHLSVRQSSGPRVLTAEFFSQSGRYRGAAVIDPQPQGLEDAHISDFRLIGVDHRGQLILQNSLTVPSVQIVNYSYDPASFKTFGENSPSR